MWYGLFGVRYQQKTFSGGGRQFVYNGEAVWQFPVAGHMDRAELTWVLFQRV